MAKKLLLLPGPKLLPPSMSQRVKVRTQQLFRLPIPTGIQELGKQYQGDLMVTLLLVTTAFGILKH